MSKIPVALWKSGRSMIGASVSAALAAAAVISRAVALIVRVFERLLIINIELVCLVLFQGDAVDVGEAPAVAVGTIALNAQGHRAGVVEN